MAFTQFKPVCGIIVALLCRIHLRGEKLLKGWPRPSFLCCAHVQIVSPWLLGNFGWNWSPIEIGRFHTSEAMLPINQKLFSRLSTDGLRIQKNNGQNSYFHRLCIPNLTSQFVKIPHFRH
eukprot:EG_transcript_39549